MPGKQEGPGEVPGIPASERPAPRKRAESEPGKGAAFHFTLPARTGGYEVLSAVDGPGALAAALRDRPDLVLLDVLLPGMDGCTASLTAKHIAEMAARCGADGYLVKPFETQALLGKIASLTGL